MLLRLVVCSAVVLELRKAISKNSYAKLHKAIVIRSENLPIFRDDILVEYTDAVVDGMMSAYAL